MPVFGTTVFGINARHERHIAYCCRCNSPWGTCGCAGQGIFPINRANERLMLETQILQQQGGYFGPGRQPMFCGNCRGPWGGCQCVGVAPVCGLGNPLTFGELLVEGAVVGLGVAAAVGIAEVAVEGVEAIFGGDDEDDEGDFDDGFDGGFF